MPLPTTRRELLANFDAAHARLAQELASIPAALERDCGMEGGTSPCDLVAYQLGWGRLLLSWDRLEQQGLTVEMPAPGFKWNALGPLAQAFYREHQGRSLTQLLGEFDMLAQQLRDFLENLSKEALFQPGQRQWTGPKWPVAKWFQVNTIAPYGAARTKLRRWKRQHRLSPD